MDELDDDDWDDGPLSAPVPVRSNRVSILGLFGGAASVAFGVFIFWTAIGIANHHAAGADGIFAVVATWIIAFCLAASALGFASGTAFAVLLGLAYLVATASAWVVGLFGRR
jgi:hypothetical protein